MQTVAVVLAGSADAFLGERFTGANLVAEAGLRLFWLYAGVTLGYTLVGPQVTTGYLDSEVYDQDAFNVGFTLGLQASF